MLKIIIGVKGTGKTKTLVEMVNTTAEQSEGSVVCLEKGEKLRYDVTYKARLVNMRYQTEKSFTVLLPESMLPITISHIFSLIPHSRYAEIILQSLTALLQRWHLFVTAMR